jgi:hypothetical protein
MIVPEIGNFKRPGRVVEYPEKMSHVTASMVMRWQSFRASEDTVAYTLHSGTVKDGRFTPASRIMVPSWTRPAPNAEA